MKKNGSKYLSLLLCLVMIASLLSGAFMVSAAEEETWEGKIDPAIVPETNNAKGVVRDAVKNADGSITLAFTSDVHYDGKNNNLKTWLEIAEEKYGYIDAMGFCGDMGSAYIHDEAYWEAAGQVIDYMDTQVAAGKVGCTAYTYGNHEWFVGAGGDYLKFHDSAAAMRLLRVGEAVRTDDYIIYNFGASPDAGLDWKTYGYIQSHMYTLWDDDLQAMADYLAAAPKDIPIFILTHYPVHLWQTREITAAGKLIDLLNQYPNVVLLWGHNHSNKDENYYVIRHAGDEIVINSDGDKKTLNFDYLAAGTTADAEYTGPTAGSVWTLNKGLIVTIGADGSLTYDYITLDGHIIKEDGVSLLEYRDGVNYEIYASEYVENGKAGTYPAPKAFDGYTFIGWDTDVSSVTASRLVTANYAEHIPVFTSNQKLTVDGKQVGIEMVNFDGSNYVKLRVIATLLAGSEKQFAVGYDEAANQINLLTGETYALIGGEFELCTADYGIASTQKLFVDGESKSLNAYNIGGSNYFKLRDLGDALGFTVDYDEVSRTAMILTK